jgi:2,3-bisphosphoglycerate-dependent phosphoglycerate mutase
MSESYPQRQFALPPDATELVLVRHGASAAAVPGEPFDLVGGHSDPPLAAEGERQADAVARRLARQPPAAIFATDLQRTTQTAAPLAALTGLEPHILPDLREVHLGEWEGGEFRVRAARRDPVYLRMFEEERWDVIPGAESPEPLERRVRAGLHTILATVGQGAVAVAFVHGGIVAEACRQATQSRPFAFVGADNGSITRLVVRASGKWWLRSFNDTAHLDTLE